MNDLSYYTKKHILVTGANGYIGSSLVSKLIQTPCELTLISRIEKLPSNSASIKAKIRLITADITNSRLWEQFLPGIDVVFHLAGQTSSNYSNKHPIEDLEINVIPTLRMIEVASKLPVKPSIIFAGTSTQVGYTSEPINNDCVSDSPITIYDIHKLTAENYLKYYAHTLGGKAISMRLTNVYGPGPRSSKNDRGIVNQMIQRALDNKPLTVYGNGEYIRDYIFINDVVNAFLQAGAHIDKLSGSYYLIGSGKGHSIYNMMKIIQNEVQKAISYVVPIQNIPLPENLSLIEKRNYIASSKAFQKLTSWIPNTSLEEGIAETITYYQKI